MNNNKYFSNPKHSGSVFAGALLLALTISAGNVGGQSVLIPASPPVVVTPVVVPDDYVYYPNYGVYYNSRRRQYNYLKGNEWVSQPTPYGVSARELFASPSVKMDFHDSPAKHHAQMLQKYPKNWKPSAQHDDRK